MAYTLRRPLIVSGIPINPDIDVQIARLVGVPWSLHAFERMSLVPEAQYSDDEFNIAARAAAIMLERFSPHDRIVMLGEDVCAAFDLKIPPLAFVKRVTRAYLHLPNPWDDDTQAAQALQQFLDGP